MRRAMGKIAGILLSATVAVSIAQSQGSAGGAAPKATPGQVEKITLPQVSTDLPPGPHLDVYEKNCLICHSARYVLGQPRFPRAVWQNEVKKMVEAYGAAISPADQAMIVQYLVAVRGSEQPASTPAK